MGKDFFGHIVHHLKYNRMFVLLREAVGTEFVEDRIEDTITYPNGLKIKSLGNFKYAVFFEDKTYTAGNLTKLISICNDISVEIIKCEL